MGPGTAPAVAIPETGKRSWLRFSPSMAKGGWDVVKREGSCIAFPWVKLLKSN